MAFKNKNLFFHILRGHKSEVSIPGLESMLGDTLYLKSLGENPFLSLPVSDSFCHSLAFGCVLPVFEISIFKYLLCIHIIYSWLPRWLSGKEYTCNEENTGNSGLTPGSGRCPGGRNDNQLQYSCLESSVNRGAWQATVPRVAKSQTQLSTCAHTPLYVLQFPTISSLKDRYEWS